MLDSWRPLESPSTDELVALAGRWAAADTPNLSAISQALTALTTELAERSTRARRASEWGESPDL